MLTEYSGGTYPAQAVLFSRTFGVFELHNADKIRSRGDFWALMFFVVALANLVIYFVVGWVTAIISQVSMKAMPRLDEHILTFAAEVDTPLSTTTVQDHHPSEHGVLRSSLSCEWKLDLKTVQLRHQHLGASGSQHRFDPHQRRQRHVQFHLWYHCWLEAGTRLRVRSTSSTPLLWLSQDSTRDCTR